MLCRSHPAFPENLPDPFRFLIHIESGLFLKMISGKHDLFNGDALKNIQRLFQLLLVHSADEPAVPADSQNRICQVEVPFHKPPFQTVCRQILLYCICFVPHGGQIAAQIVQLNQFLSLFIISLNWKTALTLLPNNLIILPKTAKRRRRH